MKDRKLPVKAAVRAFYTSKLLSDNQQQSLDDLQQSLKTHQSIRSNLTLLIWTGSIAASLLLFITVFSYIQTPDLIIAAYADTLKDSNLNNGMETNMKEWMTDNHINSAPIKYPVEMSKICKLNQYKTTHLRIAGAEQGTMHIFFHNGEMSTHWRKSTGTIDELNWKLIKVRDKLTVIVFYTDDMRESAIQNILGEMLPELHA